VHLTLYWQALVQMDESYNFFTHLLDGENRIWGQQDNIPCNGTRPTTSWVEGEVVVDEYDIVVQPGAPPGEYVIAIGMYEAAIGRRLTVVDEKGQVVDNRILLDESVQIR